MNVVTNPIMKVKVKVLLWLEICNQSIDLIWICLN